MVNLYVKLRFLYEKSLLFLGDFMIWAKSEVDLLLGFSLLGEPLEHVLFLDAVVNDQIFGPL
jgi:hypothetical protein